PAGECFYGCDDNAPTGSWDASADGSLADDQLDGGKDPEPLHPLCGVGSCHPDFVDDCDAVGTSAGTESARAAEDDADSGDDDSRLADEDAGAPGEKPGDDEDAGIDDDTGEGEVEDGGSSLVPP